MKPRNTEIRSQLLAGMVKKMSFMLRELDLPPEEVRTRDHATFLTVYSDPQTFFSCGTHNHGMCCYILRLRSRLKEVRTADRGTRSMEVF